MTIDITNPEVAAHFTELNAHQWQCKSTGKILQYGILSAYKAYGNFGLCGLTYLGLPLSNEVPIAGKPGRVRQTFECGVLCYDPPPHEIDTRPGLEQASIYPLKLYDGGPGQDPLVQHLQSQFKAMVPAAPDPRLASYTQRLTQIHDLSAI